MGVPVMVRLPPEAKILMLGVTRFSSCSRHNRGRRRGFMEEVSKQEWKKARLGRSKIA
jgi:hypothetical protein